MCYSNLLYPVYAGGEADEAEKVREMLQPLADAYTEEVKASSGSLPKLTFMYEGPNVSTCLQRYICAVCIFMRSVLPEVVTLVK